MSKIILCGSFGCKVVEIDDIAASKAKADSVQWKQAEKKKRGKFPTRNEQMEFLTHAYERHKSIHIRNLHRKTRGSLQ